MKALRIAMSFLLAGSIAVACATRSGSEPSVPKTAIEKSAATKIPDAGPNGSSDTAVGSDTAGDAAP